MPVLPKMGIPDIYENEINKQRFAQFPESCMSANSADKISHFSRSALGFLPRFLGAGPSLIHK